MDKLEESHEPTTTEKLTCFGTALLILTIVILISVSSCVTAGYPKAFGNITVSPWVLTPAQQDRKRTKEFIKNFNTAAEYIRKGLER